MDVTEAQPQDEPSPLSSAREEKQEDRPKAEGAETRGDGSPDAEGPSRLIPYDRFREVNERRKSAEAALGARDAEIERLRSERTQARPPAASILDEVEAELKPIFQGGQPEMVRKLARTLVETSSRIAEEKARQAVEPVRHTARAMTNAQVNQTMEKEFPDFLEGTDFHQAVINRASRITNLDAVDNPQQKYELLRACAQAEAGGRTVKKADADIKEREKNRLRSQTGGKGASEASDSLPEVMTAEWIESLSLEQYNKLKPLIDKAVREKRFR